jgi:hypothetical protein
MTAVNVTNLNNDYAAAIPGGLDWVNAGTQPISDATITASGLDAFVNNLSTVINNNRTNTVLIEEFYCHSNCHGSCHGSL